MPFVELKTKRTCNPQQHLLPLTMFVPREKTINVIEESFVLLETMAAVGVATQGLKLAIRRPRPNQYTPEYYRRSLSREVSFPSGHTATVAGGAMSLAATFWWKYPNSPWRFAVAGAGIVATTLVGVGRVRAGVHFPTDVLAGAAIGGSLGLLIPWLHLRERNTTLSVVPTSHGTHVAMHWRF